MLEPHQPRILAVVDAWPASPRLLQAWNADQLRDDFGRWASDAGAAISKAADKLKDVLKDDLGSDRRAGRSILDVTKERVAKAWKGVKEVFAAKPDNIPVAVELDPDIGRKSDELRQKAANHSIGEVTKAFERFGIDRQQTFNQNVRQNPTVRSEAIAQPGKFDAALNATEDHLNIAMHFTRDDEQRTLLSRKLDEVQGLRDDVNRFRERFQPEAPQSVYRPSPNVPVRPTPPAGRVTHADTADRARVADTIATPSPPASAPSGGSGAGSGRQGSEHFGRRGAAGVNTYAAMEHISGGGSPASAVEHVMTTGGVGRSTARRYVRAAVQAAATLNRQRIQALRKGA